MEERELMNEMESAELETNVEVEENEQKWFNAAGEEVSKSAFIREKFEVANMSRKEISEQFNIPYRTVYGATVNMVNDAEPSSRGRGVVNPKINVTIDNEVLVVEGDKHFLNGEEITAEEAGALETTETDRNEWIVAQVEAGVGRGDVAKILGLSYGVIYGLTKDAEGTRQKHEIELEDGTAVSRSEYIRMRVAEGASKADVARELGVEYSVVWQATKKVKTNEEKFQEAVAALEKFVDKVVDVEGFKTTVELLKAMEIVEEAEETTEA